jgi:malonate transporter
MLIGYSGQLGALFISLLAPACPGHGQAQRRCSVIPSPPPTVPIYGLTVLEPIYGEQVGTGIVRLAELITSLTQVSIAVFLLQSAAANSVAAKSVMGASTLATIGRSAANPLVWSPIVGATFAVFGLPLSPYVSTALKPLAASAAGVATFASGLVLAAHRIKLTSPTVIIGSLISLLVQPALFFIIVRVAGVSGAMADADFVASTMPTSTLSVLFAQHYAACEAETASIMVVTTFGMLVALPTSIALNTYL